MAFPQRISSDSNVEETEIEQSIEDSLLVLDINEQNEYQKKEKYVKRLSIEIENESNELLKLKKLLFEKELKLNKQKEELKMYQNDTKLLIDKAKKLNKNKNNNNNTNDYKENFNNHINPKNKITNNNKNFIMRPAIDGFLYKYIGNKYNDIKFEKDVKVKYCVFISSKKLLFISDTNTNQSKGKLFIINEILYEDNTIKNKIKITLERDMDFIRDC